jgi:predicted anti-sigma-YlaC factor YlaD
MNPNREREAFAWVMLAAVVMFAHGLLWWSINQGLVK